MPPRPRLVHRWAVLRAGRPVAHERLLAREAREINRAPKVDQLHALGCPPAGAVCRVRTRPLVLAVEAHETVVDLQVAVDHAGGVHRCNRAQQFDRVEQRKHFVDAAGACGRDACRPGRIHKIKERALRAVLEHEHRLGVQRHKLARTDDRRTRLLVGEALAQRAQHIELPWIRRRLDLESDEPRSLKRIIVVLVDIECRAAGQRHVALDILGKEHRAKAALAKEVLQLERRVADHERVQWAGRAPRRACMCARLSEERGRRGAQVDVPALLANLAVPLHEERRDHLGVRRRARIRQAQFLRRHSQRAPVHSRERRACAGARDLCRLGDRRERLEWACMWRLHTRRQRRAWCLAKRRADARCLCRILVHILVGARGCRRRGKRAAVVRVRLGLGVRLRLGLGLLAVEHVVDLGDGRARHERRTRGARPPFREPLADGCVEVRPCVGARRDASALREHLLEAPLVGRRERTRLVEDGTDVEAGVQRGERDGVALRA